MFGPSEEGLIRRVLPDHQEEGLQAFLQAYEDAHDLCTGPFPGVLDLLQWLKANQIHAAIVSGKGAGSAEISLRRTGLAPYFDTVETGSPDGIIKHKSIGKVLQAWDLPPDRVAYVGDAPADVTSAREAGVVPLAAAWAATAHVKRLQAMHPAALFLSIAELQAWLEAHLAANTAAT